MARKRSTMKHRTEHEVRPTAGDGAPPIEPPLPPGAMQKSPVPPQVEAQAKKLIHDAGSCDAAKTAVDVAADRENAPDFQEDHFALRWGFTSRADLHKASKPLSAPDGISCWATELPNGRWIQWSKEDMSAGESFSSFDELQEQLDVSPG